MNEDKAIDRGIKIAQYLQHARVLLADVNLNLEDPHLKGWVASLRIMIIDFELYLESIKIIPGR